MTGWEWFLALTPVAVYLMLMGSLNLARHPVVLTGMQDRVLLGLASIGLIIVGPVELFLPLPVYVAYGPAIWLIAIVLLTLTIGLIILTSAPKLVILNISPYQARSIISETAVELDAESRWAGDCLLIPSLGVQLYLSVWPSWRNVTLVAIGGKQDYQGWRQFGRALTKRLAGLQVKPNTRGLLLVGVGAIALAVSAAAAFHDPTVLARVFQRILPL